MTEQEQEPETGCVDPWKDAREVRKYENTGSTAVQAPSFDHLNNLSPIQVQLTLLRCMFTVLFGPNEEPMYVHYNCEFLTELLAISVSLLSREVDGLTSDERAEYIQRLTEIDQFVIDEYALPSSITVS